MQIVIESQDLSVPAELDDTPAAQDIYDALPIDGLANTWGDEIYFDVPVVRDLDETARETVSFGDLGYWPSGRMFCIFFGATPISAPGEIRPASAVNIIGRVTGDAQQFQNVAAGTKIRLQKAEIK